MMSDRNSLDPGEGSQQVDPRYDEEWYFCTEMILLL